LSRLLHLSAATGRPDWYNFPEVVASAGTGDHDFRGVVPAHGVRRPIGRPADRTADRNPDEHKQHIFDTFHRAHAGAGYTGTGLGLAISRRIIDRHGGTIAVADNPGDGTRFRFTLPYADLPTPCTPEELIRV
jgi:hypothetical protein